jgi:thiosulfate/3-mercaptopyruvate sulfurtransferase
MKVSYKTFISAFDLAALLDGPEPPVVIDCRFILSEPERGRQAYSAGHLPTAVYAHLDEDLSGPIVPGVTGRHPLPDPDKLAARLGAWGISKGVQVVAYDASNGGYAARLWWLLRWLGHEAAAVLDGGWGLWTKAGGPVTYALPQPEPAVFHPDLQEGMVVHLEDVIAMRSDSGKMVLDARTADRFAGENENIDPVAGHIPGAKNLPYVHTHFPDGTSLPKDALQKLFADTLGQVQPGDVAVYCGSGVTAARNILAMEHAGLPGAKLYAGSWSEWIQHSDQVSP